MEDEDDHAAHVPFGEFLREGRATVLVVLVEDVPEIGIFGRLITFDLLYYCFWGRIVLQRLGFGAVLLFFSTQFILQKKFF